MEHYFPPFRTGIFSLFLLCVSGISATSCPGDSGFSQLRNSCECLPCPGKPVCGAEGRVELIHPGKGIPGRCCDDYVCIPPVRGGDIDESNHNSDAVTKECSSVVCPSFAPNISCPADSTRVPARRQPGSCCALPPRCECKPECGAPLLCPRGYKASLLRSGNRTIPGSCCDSLVCALPEQRVHQPTIRSNSQRDVLNRTTSCTFDGEEYADGARWTASDVCTECSCRNGIALCKEVQCPVLHCEAPVMRNGSCCLVCEDCISSSGTFHKNTESWKEDDCTTCSCLNGHTDCQVEECRFSCPESESVKTPGQCCPTCNETQEYSSIVMPAHCPSVDKCKLRCQHGYVRDVLDGCFKCECKVENCTLSCEFGYEADPVTGEGRCSCLQNSLETRNATGICPPVTQCAAGCVHQAATSGKCPTCKCHPECPEFRVEKCAKECRNGYTAINGCLTCHCLGTDSGDPEQDLSTTPATSLSRKAIACGNASSALELISWIEGCHECVCYKGRKMCDLPATCSNGQIRDSSTTSNCCASHSDPTLNVFPKEMAGLCDASATGAQELDPSKFAGICSPCICFGGAVYCAPPSCPPLACVDGLEHLPGDCCPTCKNRNDAPMETAQPGGRAKVKCEKGDVVHETGEVWWESPCRTCSCFDGALKCSNVECPALDCDMSFSRLGSCCPICLNASDSAVPKCGTDGKTYSHGDKWELDCHSCECIRGVPNCLPVDCLSQCTNNADSICCKTCKTKGSTDLDGISTPVDSDAENYLPLFWIPFIVIGILALMGLSLCLFLRLRRQKLNSFAGQKYESCRTSEKSANKPLDKRKKGPAELLIFTKNKAQNLV